ncbi:hypothetical protein Hanom_Chr05g00402361 [Helianthus anomalus]
MVEYGWMECECSKQSKAKQSQRWLKEGAKSKIIGDGEGQPPLRNILSLCCLISSSSE